MERGRQRGRVRGPERRQGGGSAALGLLLAILVSPRGALAAERTRSGPAMIPVAAAGEVAARYRLRLSPDPIVLGDTKRATFLVEAPEPAGDLRPLRASVNVGSVGAIERIAPGRYQVVYTPPETRFPQVVILALWREMGFDSPTAFFRVPLLGRARIHLEAAPGATVFAEAGGVKSAPARADASGQVEVRLVVPPGVHEAKLRMKVEGQPDRAATYPLHVPAYNRMTLAVVPHTLPADGRSQARILIFYDAEGGTRQEVKDVVLKTSVGRLSKISVLGPQVLAARLTAPPRGTRAKIARIRARSRRDPASSAHVALQVGPPVAARVLVRATPDHILGDGETPIDVAISVLDAQGLGVTGAKVKVRAELPGKGGQVEALKALGGGRYRLRVAPIRYTHRGPPAQARLEVRVGAVRGEARITIDPWVAVGLRVDPEQVSVLADGHTRVVLRVRAVDARDRVLRGFRIEATTDRGHLTGDGTLDEAGVATFEYRPPRIVETAIARAEATRTLESEILLRGGGVERRVPLHLTPLQEVVAGERAYLEVQGGLATNLGVLMGPRVAVSGGLRLLTGRRWVLETGLEAGATGVSAVTAPGGDTGAGLSGAFSLLFSTAEVEVRAALLGRRLRFEVALAGGGALLQGRVAAAGAEPSRVRLLAPTAQARLGLGLRVGPGRVVLGAGWGLFFPPSSASLPGGGVGVRGQVRGLEVGLGYRLEI